MISKGTFTPGQFAAIQTNSGADCRKVRFVWAGVMAHLNSDADEANEFESTKKLWFRCGSNRN